VAKVVKSSQKGGAKPGERRGGRQKGTPNKKNAATIAAIAKAGVTPLEYMLDVMRKPLPKDASAEVKASIVSMQFEAAKAAAPYVHPRLSAVETGKPGEFKELQDKGELKQRIKERSVRLGIAKNVIPIKIAARQ
jgi:hypothetical protein